MSATSIPFTSSDPRYFRVYQWLRRNPGKSFADFERHDAARSRNSKARAMAEGLNEAEALRFQKWNQKRGFGKTVAQWREMRDREAAKNQAAAQSDSPISGEEQYLARQIEARIVYPLDKMTAGMEHLYRLRCREGWLSQYAIWSDKYGILALDAYKHLGKPAIIADIQANARRRMAA